MILLPLGTCIKINRLLFKVIDKNKLIINIDIRPKKIINGIENIID
jgi:hypothetical protein